MPNNEHILNAEARKAVHAIRDAAHATEVARQIQAEQATEQAAQIAAQTIAQKLVDEQRMGEITYEQVMKALSMGSEKDRAVVLARVPYICSEITNINKTLEEIKKAVIYVPLMQKMLFTTASMVLVSVVGALIALVVM
jgi:hypothetical protein